jgi:hypothetical protein
MLRLFGILSCLFMVLLLGESSRASLNAECLNAFCSLNADHIGLGAIERTLVNRYGEGFVTEVRTTTRVLNRTHCYYLAQEKLWVELVVDYHHSEKDEGGQVEEVFISKESLCDKKYTPANPAGRFLMAKGVSIGDPEGLVLQRYGKPSLIVDTVERERKAPSLKQSRFGSRFGTTVLRYLGTNTDHYSTDFFLKESLVHSLWIGTANE